MIRVLVIAEHDGRSLSPATAKTVRCAQDLHAEALEVAVLARDGAHLAGQAATLAGVGRVLQLDHPAHERPLAAALAPHVVELAAGHTHVLGPSTTFGKDLMPRVAALLDTAQVSDLMEVLSPYRFKRPIYAGNVVVTIEAPEDRPVVATVRTASFAPAGGGGAATVERVTPRAEPPGHTRSRGLERPPAERPDLQTAPRVVAGGRALGSAESFELIHRLADRLGAAVGATRAAVDAGYAPNDLQVGQTGKIIAPDLYIAVGISGAIQHLTGIRDAGTIVAINRDSEAPIFEVADIGLVGDLFEILPELERRLS